MENRRNKFLNTVAALFLIGFTFFILKELQSILLPLFMALIISFLFEPFYEWMKKKGIPSALSLAIVILTIILLANISSVFIWTSIGTFKEEIPKYVKKGDELITSFQHFINGLNIPKDYKKSLNISNILNGEKIEGIVSDLVSGIAGLFTNFILILIYVIFLLTEFASIRRRIIKAFDGEKAHSVNSILTDILIDVRKYIVGKTTINFLHAVTIFIIFIIFGLDFAILWALLTFILAYIPNIGALIATLLPFFTALLQYDSVVIPIILLIIMVVTGSVYGNIIEPKVLGDKLNLSPILLLFSLLFWGYLWGIVGMILSVPVMSMIKIVLAKFDSTRPIAILMSYEIERIPRRNLIKNKFITKNTKGSK